MLNLGVADSESETQTVTHRDRDAAGPGMRGPDPELSIQLTGLKDESGQSICGSMQVGVTVCGTVPFVFFDFNNIFNCFFLSLLVNLFGK